LIFSIHEAKGLEYENVILTDFVSAHETAFHEITSGVSFSDLKQEELRYNRAGNKHDKDAEVYKFYINSFYVAITRAIKNIYIFEQRADHPMLKLMQILETRDDIKIVEAKSTKEEWLEEARRLEEQGKYEQAEQIRAKYLGYEYLSPEQLEIICERALNPSLKESEVKKERKQLFQYAINHRRYDWVDALAKLQFQRAILYMKELRADRKEYEKSLRLGIKQKVQAIAQKYGVDFANEDDVTGLMTALHHGQSEIALHLLAQGAATTLADKSKRIAADYLLGSYLTNKRGKQKQPQLANEQTLLQFWEKVRPQSLVYDHGERQFRINSRSMLFFLMLLMRSASGIQYMLGNQIRQLLRLTSYLAKSPLEAQLRAIDIASSEYPMIYKLRQEVVQNKEIDEKDIYSTVCQLADNISIFSMDDFVELAALIPDEILPPYRKKRNYINSILAANEISKKDSPYCKESFVRVKRGMYCLNTDMIF